MPSLDAEGGGDELAVAFSEDSGTGCLRGLVWSIFDVSQDMEVSVLFAVLSALLDDASSLDRLLLLSTVTTAVDDWPDMGTSADEFEAFFRHLGGLRNDEGGAGLLAVTVLACCALLFVDLLTGDAKLA